MKITPLDIDGHTFRKKLRGYDPEEVRSFLHHAPPCTEMIAWPRFVLASRYSRVSKGSPAATAYCKSSS